MNKAILDLARRATGCRDPIVSRAKPIPKPVEPVEPVVEPEPPRNRTFDFQGSDERKKSDQEDLRDYIINLFKEKKQEKIFSEGIIIKEKYNLDSFNKKYKIKKYSYLDEF